MQQTKPGQLEIPKLRKVVKEPEPEEKKEDKEKEKKIKKTVKKKKESEYELPEIPDYERPALEKYEKSDFDPTRRVSWVTNFIRDAETQTTNRNTIAKNFYVKTQNLCDFDWC